MRKLHAALLVTVTLCANAHAQWYATLYLGAAHTSNSHLDVRQPGLDTNVRFAGVPYEGQSFQSPLYYGFQIGNFFSAHFGLNAEFTHLKVFAKVKAELPASGVLNGFPINSRQPMDDIVQHFAISHGVNLLTANIVARQQFWKPPGERLGRLRVLIQVGGGVTIPHAESVIQQQQDEHYQVGSPGFQAGAGVDFQVRGRFRWMAEYKYTRVAEKVNVYQGTAQTLLNSNHVVTGPIFYF